MFQITTVGPENGLWYPVVITGQTHWRGQTGFLTEEKAAKNASIMADELWDRTCRFFTERGWT